jgi:hypothetical protein
MRFNVVYHASFGALPEERLRSADQHSILQVFRVSPAGTFSCGEIEE